MSQDKSVFKRKDGLSWRWENDQEIIIYRGGKFIWLNPVAAFIFYYCQGSSCAQIVELLGRGYRISEKLLLKHTRRFLSRLIEEGIVVESPEDKRVLMDEFPNRAAPRYKEFIPPQIAEFRIGSSLQYSFKRPSTPLRVFFTLTQKCNLSCKSCYNDALEDAFPEADLGNIMKVIDRIKEAKVLEVIITGGEPFLYPEIFKVIDYLMAGGIGVRINTNGLLLDERLIAELKKRKGVTLTLGLDGTTQKAHDSIRGEGNFRKAVDILKRLSREGINLYVNFTATHDNFLELFKLRRFLRGFNVSQIIVNIFIRSGRGYAHRNTLELSKVEYALLNLPGLFGPVNVRPGMVITTSCYAGYIEANIDYSGSFFFCELLKHPLGNILERDIRDIWNAQEFTNLIDADKFGFPCNRCFFRKGCRGSCRAEVFSATADIYAGNPYCLRGKLMAKLSEALIH